METEQAGTESGSLPPGWKRFKNERGRIQYDSPPPLVSIRSKSQLIRYHKSGKFTELDANQVTFIVSRKKSEKTYVMFEGGTVNPSRIIERPAF